MTARQSKPPLSRRQLRAKPAGGSDDSVTPASDDAEVTGATENAAITPVAGSGGRRVRWDPTATTVDGGAREESGPAPTTPDVPTADRPGTDVQSPSSGEPAAAEPPAAFRQRDYRPEGRRSSFAPAFVAGETPDNTEAAPTGDVAEDAATGDGSRSDIDLTAPERTMTRRELRILRARAEAAGLPAPDVMFLANGESTVTGAIPVLDGVAFAPDAADVNTESASTDDVGTEKSSGEPTGVVAEEPVADAAGVVTEEPVADTPTTPESDDIPVIPALVEPDPTGSARFPVDAAATPAVPTEIVVEAEPATGDHPVAEATVSPVDQPEPAPTADESEPGGGSDSSDTPAPGRLRPFDALFLPPSARADDDALDTASAQPVNDTDGLRGDILAAPAGASRPFGHWSTQDDDDDAAVGETPITRDVGTGVVTTHALVLPSIPDAGEPLLSPLTSTGEVMVTGIVELPKSYGSTGAHPALFDHPEVDSIIDDTDREDADSGAAPVRATRAVSSTTTTRSMVETAPTKRSRVLPVIAIVVGGVVLVAAASWAIAAIFFNAF